MAGVLLQLLPHLLGVVPLLADSGQIRAGGNPVRGVRPNLFDQRTKGLVKEWGALAGACYLEERSDALGALRIGLDPEELDEVLDRTERHRPMSLEQGLDATARVLLGDRLENARIEVECYRLGRLGHGVAFSSVA